MGNKEEDKTQWENIKGQKETGEDRMNQRKKWAGQEKTGCYKTGQNKSVDMRRGHESNG